MTNNIKAKPQQTPSQTQSHGKSKKLENSADAQIFAEALKGKKETKEKPKEDEEVFEVEAEIEVGNAPEQELPSPFELQRAQVSKVQATAITTKQPESIRSLSIEPKEMNQLIEKLQAHVETVRVGSKSEVHINLNNAALPQTNIVISKNAGILQVQFHSQNSLSRQKIELHKGDLTKRLRRLGASSEVHVTLADAVQSRQPKGEEQV